MNNERKGSVENNQVPTPTATTTATTTTTNTAISCHASPQQDELEPVPEMSAANEQETQKDATNNAQEQIRQATHTLNDINNAIVPTSLTTFGAGRITTTTTTTTISTNVEVVAGHLQKSDKCVCTQDTLEDLQRALTYEAVFNSLLEQKVLAMKRDCEERKRIKRMKRKSLGRLLFSKKLFSSRKSISGRLEGQTLHETEHMYNADLNESATSGNKVTAKKSVARSHTVDEIEVASPVSIASQRSFSQKTDSVKSARLHDTAVTAADTQESQAQADDSIASSTVSNSSAKHVTKRNLLVRAQTHTPAAETTLSSNSSPDSKELPMARHSSILNGNGSARLASSLEQRTIDDTASLASGYDNGTGARVHTSTMADDSLTSLRGSIESLSFASSRCTVSFGGTEIIPEDASSYLYEHVRAAKRLRLLEAKSISAQCSPIFPRYVIQNAVATSTQATEQIAQKPVTTTAAVTAISTIQTVRPFQNSATQTTQTRLLPNQVSYTDSMYGCVLNADGSRNISRQNTSEDSANVTMSTLLNQSDSCSLQTPAYFVTTTTTGSIDAAHCTALSATDRYKSRSASLLLLSGKSRSHPPLRTRTLDVPNIELPIKQLEQLHIYRNQPIDSLDNKIIPESHFEEKSSKYYPNIISTTAAKSIKSSIIDVKKFTNNLMSTKVTTDSVNLKRMTSTSTASSAVPTGCCTTTKSFTTDREKQRFIPRLLTADQSGSDDEYRKRKRKYKRYHRCSDPVLVYPTPSGLQHCVISMPSNDPSQFQFGENFLYDAQLDMELDKTDDLEQIVSSSTRKHRRHRHHRHKKRRRHKKSKILVQDLENQTVKVIDPDDLSARARWTIIATACLLLLMCLMLVGITLRMAPIIDDMVRQENERLMKETMERARFGKNFTESASLLSTAAQLMTSSTMRQQQQQPQQQHQLP